MRLAVLLAALSSACCIVPTEPPGQDFATQIVWEQQYLMVGRPSPPITWIQGSQLNCHDGQGWTSQDAKTVPDECVAGLHYDNPEQIYVAWPDMTQFISQTAFAHELCHAWSFETTGDADRNHLGPCFNPPGNYVAIANDALAKVDL